MINNLQELGEFNLDIYFDNQPTEKENELNWPQTPSGILIMGKRQGTKRANKQLAGRVAMAAALWYSAPRPKPYLIFVASDIHGPFNTPDAQVVQSNITERYNIPRDYLILRRKSNCTVIEVRAARAICRAYDLATIFAITHLYHAPRTQRYLDEVLPDAAVIPVHPTILDEIGFPLEAAELLDDLRQTIEASLPRRLDQMREYWVEWILSRAHTVDPRGRLERRLARLLRPGTY